MVRLLNYIVLVLILAHIAAAFVFNDTLLEGNGIQLNGNETRRRSKNRNQRSTSSDSGELASSKDDKETLEQSFTSSSSGSEDSNGMKKRHRKRPRKREPVSSLEHTGWRKWHRKCTKCPDDMRKRWRDPSINWICGAYQQARRTFKSTCMMYYRNCQDGTMFTKISDHRCNNGTQDGIRPYRFHFFYDYKVVLTEDESDSKSDTDADTPDSSSSVSESELMKRLPPFVFH